MSTWPTLYKKTSTGATQQWTISVAGSTITVVHGQVGGALQTSCDTVHHGKNIGRSNETTPAEQAKLEATAKWKGKQAKGYNSDLAAARAGKVDEEHVAGGVSPMLAHKWRDHGSKMKFPCAAQTKLDGHRAIALVENDGSVTLWSRSRKPILSVPHINRAVEKLGLLPETVLDGELYNHHYRHEFERLTSMIKKSTPQPETEGVIQYHVYDMVDPYSPGEPFSSRARKYEDILGFPDGTLIPVETIEVQDEVELMEFFTDCLADAYEGAMARSLDGLYKGSRSRDLLKIKDSLDKEFEIVDVEQGRGKMAGKAVFVCETPTGERFKAKMKGSIADLAKYVDDPSLAIGQQLTVQYQELTGYGMPRFPVGLRIRNDL